MVGKTRSGLIFIRREDMIFLGVFYGLERGDEYIAVSSLKHYHKRLDSRSGREIGTDALVAASESKSYLHCHLGH